jgi:hypothetical protein
MVKIIGIGLMLSMALISCNQGNAQSNANEKTIVGTWSVWNYSDTTLIFNSDGTVTLNGQSAEWLATDTIIAMHIGHQFGTGLDVGEYNYYYNYSFSNDGETLILIDCNNTSQLLSIPGNNNIYHRILSNNFVLQKQ